MVPPDATRAFCAFDGVEKARFWKPEKSMVLSCPEKIRVFVLSEPLNVADMFSADSTRKSRDWTLELSHRAAPHAFESVTVFASPLSKRPIMSSTAFCVWALDDMSISAAGTGDDKHEKSRAIATTGIAVVTLFPVLAFASSLTAMLVPVALLNITLNIRFIFFQSD